MGQRWLTWVIALLLIAGVTTVFVVFLVQGDGPPDYESVIGDFSHRGVRAGEFDSPAGVAVDSSGNLFVVDTANSRVQRFDPNGKHIEDWAATPGSDRGQFRNPLRAAFNREGILWISDTDNHRLQSFDTRGGPLSEFGSLGQGPGQFSHPIGLAFDPAGNMWVADSGNHRIQKIGPGAKNVLAIIPEDHKPSSVKGEFNTPWGVVCDATGSVYVADTYNHRIQRFAKDGTFLNTFGTMGDKPGEFNKPTSLLIDRVGALFVVDSGNNRVQKFDGQGQFLTEWGKKGNLAREFNNPQQITQGPDGMIYIADTGNHRIQKYRPRKSPLFQQDHDLQIPTKPRAPEQPSLDMPEVPTDNPTATASGQPDRPASSATPTSPGTPLPEPTRF